MATSLTKLAQLSLVAGTALGYPGIYMLGRMGAVAATEGHPLFLAVQPRFYASLWEVLILLAG